MTSLFDFKKFDNFYKLNFGTKIILSRKIKKNQSMKMNLIKY